MSDNTVRYGGGGCLGFVLSFIISYAMNGFWWALLHGFLSWFYILYVIIFRTKEIIPALVRLFT